METKQLKTISFQLESKCKRTESGEIAFVPKFNVKDKEFGVEYKAQIKVYSSDLAITDTYFKCKDNTLLNVPLDAIKGIPLTTLKTFYTKGCDMVGVGGSVSSQKGRITKVNDNNTFDFTLDKDIYYIIQD